MTEPDGPVKRLLYRWFGWFGVALAICFALIGCATTPTSPDFDATAFIAKLDRKQPGPGPTPQPTPDNAERGIFDNTAKAIVDHIAENYDIHATVGLTRKGQRVAVPDRLPSEPVTQVAEKPDKNRDKVSGSVQPDEPRPPVETTPSKSPLAPKPETYRMEQAIDEKYSGLVMLSLPDKACGPCEQFKNIAGKEGLTFKTCELLSGDDFQRWHVEDTPVFVMFKAGVERTRILGGFDGSMVSYRDIVRVMNMAVTSDDPMPKCYVRKQAN